MKSDEEIRKLAEFAWDEDIKTNPSTPNPYSFVYGFRNGYKEAMEEYKSNSLHGVEVKSAEELNSNARSLIYKIVENWGNAIYPVSVMTEWLNEYANQFKSVPIVDDWISVETRLPGKDLFGGYLVLFNNIHGEQVQCVATFQSVPRHAFENPPIDKRWFVFPSNGHEIRPTHWRPLLPPPNKINK